MVLPGEAVKPEATFLLSWLENWFAGDEYAKAATRRALLELLVFYIFIGLGFGLLYFTWKSNQNLRRWKADFKTTVEAQRGRKFEADTAKMYGMF